MPASKTGPGAFQPNMPHGHSRYVNRGCRCMTCVSDHARANLEGVEARAGKLTLGDPRHGTLNGYNNWRCRCGDCREAMSEYYRVRRGVSA